MMPPPSPVSAPSRPAAKEPNGDDEGEAEEGHPSGESGLAGGLGKPVGGFFARSRPLGWRSRAMRPSPVAHFSPLRIQRFPPRETMPSLRTAMIRKGLRGATVALATLASLSACKKSNSSSGEISRNWLPPEQESTMGVPAAEVKSAIQTRLAAKAPVPISGEDWKRVQKLYTTFNQSLLWLDDKGVEQPRVAALLTALASADSDAVHLNEYPVPRAERCTRRDRQQEGDGRATRRCRRIALVGVRRVRSRHVVGPTRAERARPGVAHQSQRRACRQRADVDHARRRSRGRARADASTGPRITILCASCSVGFASSPQRVIGRRCPPGNRSSVVTRFTRSPSGTACAADRRGLRCDRFRCETAGFRSRHLPGRSPNSKRITASSSTACSARKRSTR